MVILEGGKIYWDIKWNFGNVLKLFRLAPILYHGIVMNKIDIAGFGIEIETPKRIIRRKLTNEAYI